MFKRNYLLFIIIILFVPVGIIHGVLLKEGDRIIIPDRVNEPPRIDGTLNETCWNTQPIDRTFINFSPNYGEHLDFQTLVWAANDSNNLYFAFKCFDDQPQQIKASISPRDKIVDDDQVGIFLDSVGNKQSCYEFFVNPRGIQADFLNSAVGKSDIAPDFVWESSAKITDQGYQVEIRIPLESIRYKSGKEVEMGVLFYRKISRLGTIGTWPGTEPGQTEYKFMATVIFHDLKGSLKLELLPNIIYNRGQEIDPYENRQNTYTLHNLGLGIKYGITSTVTAEAAIQPDFSQMESDVFQVEVNRRYPLFYEEKRPFFMEGMDIFNFGIIAKGMMIAPVHTRRIVDPAWAAKLSGTLGKTNFALLAARDNGPDIPAYFGIARLKYNIGSDNSVGILYSGRHTGKESNDVIGADLQYQLGKYLRLTTSFLYSGTNEEEKAITRYGSGINVMMIYNTPRLVFKNGFERYDRNFYMATAFQNRTGLVRGWLYSGPQFALDIKKIPWLRRIHPYLFLTHLHDLETKMNDSSQALGVYFNSTRMGVFRCEYGQDKEAWAGQLFKKKHVYFYGGLQLFKWLNLAGDFYYGDGIYYDPVEPLLGRGTSVNLQVVVQPNSYLNIGMAYSYSDLYADKGKQKIYGVQVYNLNTNCQINRYLNLRVILRFDNLQQKLLADSLASFTLIPGTVVYLGYGALYDRRQWQNGQWIYGQGDLLRIKQGLFFKASYLWRIK